MPAENIIVSDLENKYGDLLRRVQAAEERIGFIEDADPIPTPIPDEGFNVTGTPSLYKVVVLREYDEDGAIIEAGDETGTTQADIDAGHSLKATWDYVRVIAPEV